MRGAVRSNYRVGVTPRGFTFLFDWQSNALAEKQTMYYAGVFGTRKDAERRMRKHEEHGR